MTNLVGKFQYLWKKQLLVASMAFCLIVSLLDVISFSITLYAIAFLVLALIDVEVKEYVDKVIIVKNDAQVRKHYLFGAVRVNSFLKFVDHIVIPDDIEQPFQIEQINEELNEVVRFRRM